MSIQYQVLPDPEMQAMSDDRRNELLYGIYSSARESAMERISGFWSVWKPKQRWELTYAPHMPVFVLDVDTRTWLDAYGKGWEPQFMAPYVPFLYALILSMEPMPPAEVGDPMGDLQGQMQYQQEYVIWQQEVERIGMGQVTAIDLLRPYWKRLCQYDHKETAKMLREIAKMERESAQASVF